MKRCRKPFILWRRGSESNRRIKVLQTLVSRLQGLCFHRAFRAISDFARLWPGSLSQTTLDILAAEQTAAGDAFRAGDHSRGVRLWCSDAVAEEALVRKEGRDA